MKKQRLGVFAILAAALVITALVVGCMGPIDPSGLSMSGGGNSGGTEGAGSGGGGNSGGAGGGVGVVNGVVVNESGNIVLRLNFNASNARTIMPAELEEIDDDNYLVTLTRETGSAGNATITADPYDDTDGITLEAGNTYSLKVAARTTGGTVIAAGEYVDGSGAPEIIDADDPPDTAISVALYLVDNEGTGTFSYSFNFNSISAGFDVAASDTATLTITGLSAGASHQSGDIISITTNPVSDNNVVLNSGYYEVLLRVVDDDDEYFDIVLNDTLIIYQGQTTEWLNPTLPALIRNKHIISFNVNGGDSGNPANIPVPHGTTIPLTSKPTDPTHGNNDYVFYGWYTAQASSAIRDPSPGSFSGIQWVFGQRPAIPTATYVFGARTLYAAWKDTSSTPITVSFDDSGYLAYDADDLMGNLGTISDIYEDVMTVASGSYPRSVTIIGGVTAGLPTTNAGYTFKIGGAPIADTPFNISVENTNDIKIAFDFIADIDILGALCSTDGAVSLTIIAEIDGTPKQYWGGHIIVQLQPGSPSPSP